MCKIDLSDEGKMMNNTTQNLTAGKRVKALISVALILIATGAGLWYWKQSNTQSGGWGGSGPVPVNTTTATAGPVNKVLAVPGELQAVQQVLLTTEVAGKVSAIHFKAGQHVKAGDVLVSLNTSVEEADLKAAEARNRFASRQLQRAENLAPTRALTEETLQQRQADYDEAQAVLAQLKARIRQKRIVAPFDGVIGLRQINLGQYVMPGEAAATLTRMDKMFVNFDVSQNQRALLADVEQVRFFTGESSDASDTSLIADISATEVRVNRDTRNIQVQAVFDNTKPQLQPGMYVQVELSLGVSKNAIQLPASAVLTSAYGETVVVVRNPDDKGVGMAEYVSVVVEERIDDSVVISSGLNAGDVIVREGQLRVQPGAQVQITNTQARAEGGE
ncbi:MAG: efflux transporter periplasmic adaptor subunit [Thalassolituus sp.]|nr:MAG: efflux transporter periplasmic adaptor subunit [Thalassolituus sp.]